MRSALMFILAFVGVKRMLAHGVRIPDLHSVAIIGVALGPGIRFSPREVRAPIDFATFR